MSNSANMLSRMVVCALRSSGHTTRCRYVFSYEVLPVGKCSNLLAGTLELDDEVVMLNIPQLLTNTFCTPRTRERERLMMRLLCLT